MKAQLATEAAAKAARVRASLGLSIDEPANPFDAALQLGLEVRLLALGSLEGMYSPDDNGLIVVGSERPRGRRCFTCAHELGHHSFGHGQRMDELVRAAETSQRDEAELQADRFAASFLMPKVAVLSALSQRGWSTETIGPREVYTVAGMLGVGYTTLVDHMWLTLQLLRPAQRNQLKRIRPKDIRSQILGASTPHDLIVIDYHWRQDNVDVEVGDSLLLPAGSQSDGSAVERRETGPAGELCEAVQPGISRVSWINGGGRSIDVRVSRRGYQGLAENRHLEDPDD